MTLKKYQRIKLVIVFILALIFSQVLYLKSFILPIALMIISSLVLMLLRRRVKGVVFDERDYALGGKAALIAIQVYGWLAASGLFVLYSQREKNLVYEPIALTLAFSTCFLMLLYSFVFRYLARK